MEELNEDGLAIPNEDVHHVLTMCGIGTDVARQVFILVKGLLVQTLGVSVPLPSVLVMSLVLPQGPHFNNPNCIPNLLVKGHEHVETLPCSNSAV